jgi:hypothetical protein
MKPFSHKMAKMGHDIKRVADEEWESMNPVSFSGKMPKGDNYFARAWSDWNDDDYLAHGVDAMRNTGVSNQYARFNSATDSRKTLDIGHLDLDNFYGSHITGRNEGRNPLAYNYDPSALNKLPTDMPKLSVNDSPINGAKIRPANLRATRAGLGLPAMITSFTTGQVAEEAEEESPPEEANTDPHAPPPKTDADRSAERMNQPRMPGGGSVRASSASGAVDAGGVGSFTREEELDTMRTSGGRTIKTGHPPLTTREEAEEEEEEDEEEEEEEEEEEGEEGEEGEAKEGGGGGGGGNETASKTSRAKGGASGRKTGYKFETRKNELEASFPGITNGRKNSPQASYATLSKEQQKFLVAYAQGKPGKPSEDMLYNYGVDQTRDVEKQHDYMLSLINSHDEKEGKKGMFGKRLDMMKIAQELPRISIGKLFSLSAEGRDLVYDSVLDKVDETKMKSLTDHDLDVLVKFYKDASKRVGREVAPPTTSASEDMGNTASEERLRGSMEKYTPSETKKEEEARVKRLQNKGYEPKPPKKKSVALDA